MPDQTPILITRVVSCRDSWSDTRSVPIIIYEVETETGPMTLGVTVSAAQQLRMMPEKLPRDFGWLGGG
jgi:hypothetical protein